MTATTMHPTGKSTYILAARRSGAVLFSSRGPSAPMNLVAEIDYPRGRLKASDLETDRPGRAFDRAAQGRHAYSSEEGATDRVEHDFAVQLADQLDQYRNSGAFDQLVLVAGPKLLGKLRHALSEPTRKLVSAELDKDLVDPTEQELRKQLTGLAKV
jgi:protein required for attachment to host cells